MSISLPEIYPGTCLQVLPQALQWIRWNYIHWTTLLPGSLSSKCVLLSVPNVADGFVGWGQTWLCWLGADMALQLAVAEQN